MNARKVLGYIWKAKQLADGNYFPEWSKKVKNCKVRITRPRLSVSASSGLTFRFVPPQLVVRVKK